MKREFNAGEAICNRFSMVEPAINSHRKLFLSNFTDTPDVPVIKLSTLINH